REASTTILSLPPLEKFKREGLVNAQSLLEWIHIGYASPVLGYPTFEAGFTSYKAFGGVESSTRRAQREGGDPGRDVTITDHQPHASVAIDVPANIAAMKPPEPHVIKPEKLADGVWSLPVDERDHSVAIEFRDHIIVVEAPDSEALSAP